MRAIIFVDVETLECGTLAEPAIREPGDAIVEVSVAALCGSDLHPYLGVDRGNVVGHELVGRVLEVRAGANDSGPATASSRRSPHPAVRASTAAQA